MKDFAAIVLVLFFFLFPLQLHATDETMSGERVIADFDSAQYINNVGQPIEIWLKDDGSDDTQMCKMSFAADDAIGKPDGHSALLEYDVDSGNAAYNGMRTSLAGVDATGFKNLSFDIKGDAAKGFTKTLKIELIGRDRPPSPHMVQGITGEWQKITVPLSEFIAVTDWKALDQFVVVFADITSDPKTGAIYIDHISLSK